MICTMDNACQTHAYNEVTNYSEPTSIELSTIIMPYEALKSNAHPIETLKVVTGVQFVVICIMSSCSLAESRFIPGCVGITRNDFELN